MYGFALYFKLTPTDKFNGNVNVKNNTFFNIFICIIYNNYISFNHERLTRYY